MVADRKAAYDFLKDLQRRLKKLPPAPELSARIRGTIAAAKNDYERRHLRGPEGAFLNDYVLPVCADTIREYAGLSAGDARKALLAESYVSLRDIASDSPARTVRHPFSKVLGRSTEAIYRNWADPESGSALIQACPDFALRDPFPHKILFEGKYFTGVSRKRANDELVRDLYQAFFYRGLPAVAATARGRAAWDYDYVCLLAYDASRDGTLVQAWEELPERVRKGFWDGANIYVMILRRD